MPPWLVLLLLVSLAVALVYQLATRRFGWRILAYWLAVFLGALGAELLAEAAGIELLRVGDLRLLPDMLGALLVTGTLWFLGV